MNLLTALAKALEAYFRVYVAMQQLKLSNEIQKVTDEMYECRLRANANDFLQLDRLKARRKLLSNALTTISDPEAGGEV